MARNTARSNYLRREYFAMLVEYYIAALLADERAADEVWEWWNAGLIDDDLAAWAWSWSSIASDSESVCPLSAQTLPLI